MEENLPSPTMGLVRREAMVLARSDQFFRVLVGLTALLGLTAAFILLFTYVNGRTMAYFSLTLFRFHYYYLYFAALVVVPVAAAAAMVSEYKNECFPMLYTTLIRPGWILWAKVLSVLGMFSLLYIACMPFVGLAYFFAGLEKSALFLESLFLFSLAAATGSIGLCLSARTDNHFRGLYRTAIGVIALFVLPMPAYGLVQWLPIPSWIEAMLRYLAEDSVYHAILGGGTGWRSILTHAAYCLGVAFVLLLLARRSVLPSSDDDRTGLWMRVRDSVGRHRKPKPRAPIDDRQNPVAIRDAWLNPLSKKPVAAFICGLGFLAGFVVARAYVGVGFTNALMLTGGGLEQTILSILLPPMMALAVTSERENGTIDALRMSLLNAEEICLGKIRGVWRVIGPFFVATYAGQLAGVVVGSILSPGADFLAALPLIAISAVQMAITVHATLVFALIGAQSKGTVTGAIVMSYLSVVGYMILASMIVTVPFIVLMVALPGALPWLTGVYNVVLVNAAFLLIIRLKRQSAIQGMQKMLGRG